MIGRVRGPSAAAITREASDISHQPVTLCVTLKRKGRSVEFPFCLVSSKTGNERHRGSCGAEPSVLLFPADQKKHRLCLEG